MTKRDWSSDAYKKARGKDQELEQLMRSILKLFSQGSLVYRTRTQRSGPGVQTKSERLKRLRRALVDLPRHEQGGPAAIA